MSVAIPKTKNTAKNGRSRPTILVTIQAFIDFCYHQSIVTVTEDSSRKKILTKFTVRCRKYDWSGISNGTFWLVLSYLRSQLHYTWVLIHQRIVLLHQTIATITPDVYNKPVHGSGTELPDIFTVIPAEFFWLVATPSQF